MAKEQVATAPPAPEAGGKLKTFHVEYRDMKGDYRARSETEAWAMFNDDHKTSYGPKSPGRTIEVVEAKPAKEAAPAK